MHTDDNGQHIFSHTSLDLWRTCKRRWHWKYILGNREPTTPNMAAGTWLAQWPIEDSAGGGCTEEWWQNRYVGGKEAYFEGLWTNFLAEFGGDDSFDDPIFTIDLAKNILAAYQKSPVAGTVIDIEKRNFLDLVGEVRYQSQPDMLVERLEPIPEDSSVDLPLLTCWDIKLKTFWSKYPGAAPIIDPLLPYDDQGLGQAVCAGADAFGQIRFYVDKRSGDVHGPIYLEQPVDPVLAEEWKSDTIHEVLDIETWLKRTYSPSPKNSDACYKWGRECPAMNGCKFGFTPLTSTTKKDKE